MLVYNNREKSQNNIFHLSGENPPLKGLK